MVLVRRVMVCGARTHVTFSIRGLRGGLTPQIHGFGTLRPCTANITSAPTSPIASNDLAIHLRTRDPRHVGGWARSVPPPGFDHVLWWTPTRRPAQPHETSSGSHGRVPEPRLSSSARAPCRTPPPPKPPPKPPPEPPPPPQPPKPPPEPSPEPQQPPPPLSSRQPLSPSLPPSQPSSAEGRPGMHP